MKIRIVCGIFFNYLQFTNSQSLEADAVWTDYYSCVSEEEKQYRSLHIDLDTRNITFRHIEYDHIAVLAYSRRQALIITQCMGKSCGYDRVTCQNDQ